MSESQNTTWMNDRLDRLRAGDFAARDDLTTFAISRFEHLAHAILRGQFGRVARWVDTGDVLQNATLRLWKALAEMVPESPRHFHRLAASQIRRELIDLARHFYGPLGQGAHHESVGLDRSGDSESSTPAGEPQAPTDGPGRQLERADIHTMVQSLPDDEAEVVDLIFYQGLNQEEAAEAVGVDVRTIQRRWQRARLKLGEWLS